MKYEQLFICQLYLDQASFFFFFLKKTVFGKLSIMFKYKHQEILDGNISQWH